MNDPFAAKVPSDPVTASSNRPVTPSTLRVVTATGVALCGVLFVILGGLIVWSTTRQPDPYPVSGAVAAMGAGFVACLLWRAAYQVLVAQRARHYVLSPVIRWIFGALFGIAAIGMLLQAWNEDSIVLATKACGVGFFAFLIVRSTMRR